MARFKINGLPWWVIGLLMPGSIVNYLTRSALAVAHASRPDKPAMTSEQLVLHGQVAHP
jgi:ACS family hexuronate transporter-like MFS transporter